MRTLLIVYAVIVGILFGLGLRQAYAHTFTEEECRNYAEDVHTVAVLRDQGATKEDLKKMGTESVLEKRKDPEFYLKDDQDLNVLMESIELIFYYSKDSPAKLSAKAHAACLNHVGVKSQPVKLRLPSFV